MCMTIDTKVTAKVRKKLSKGKAKFWKVYETDGKWLYAPFYRRKKGGRFSKPGQKTSSLPTPADSHIFGNAIWEGFHVFVSKAGAESWANPDCVAVPVWCRAKDFVFGGNNGLATGRQVAVFTHIEITPGAFNTAIGRE